MPVKSVMLIKTNANENNNKFYELIEDEKGEVYARYGRVGAHGVTTPCRGVTFEQQKARKMKRGYVEAQVEQNTSGAAPSLDPRLAARALAASGFEQDDRVQQLVTLMVRTNAHQIAVFSGGKMTAHDGQVRTPLGLLKRSALVKAEELLASLREEFEERNRVSPALLEEYLMLVPQTLPRNWQYDFLSCAQDFQQQESFLRALSQSLDYSESQRNLAAAQGSDEEELLRECRKAFKYSIKPVADKNVFEYIKKKYESGVASNHPYRVRKARLRAVYELHDPAAEHIFEAQAQALGNVREMWHGTSTSNLLSILSRGLLPPRRAGGLRLPLSGSMFGSGLYFSESSTKSANYSAGGIWGGSIQETWFMLVADVAMGHEYRPTVSKPTLYDYNGILDGRYTDEKHKKVFNSINVKGGARTGVINHEAIVPGPEQVRLKYLVQFESPHR